jgi:hypothetical protein
MDGDNIHISWFKRRDIIQSAFWLISILYRYVIDIHGFIIDRNRGMLRNKRIHLTFHQFFEIKERFICKNTIHEALDNKEGIYLFSHKNSVGVPFYLHSKDVKLRGGRMQRIFYFSKDSSGAIEMPSGYIVVENKKTRLPLLKKK